MNFKLVVRICIAAVMILVLQDAILLIAGRLLGPSATISTILHVKLILYQVMLPLFAILYGCIQILASHRDRVRLEVSK